MTQGTFLDDFGNVIPQASVPTGELTPFDGDDYDHDRDVVRLTGQLQRIFDLMQDSQWRTLNAIAESTGDPAASISAQLRHLRKEKFGAHTVNKRHEGGGLYVYQLIVNRDP